MSKSKKVVLCRKCNNTMDKGTKICPTCGAKNKKPFYKRWWFVLFAVFVIIVFLGTIDGGSEKISWEEIGLSNMLPEPKSNKGNIIVNSNDSLSIYIEKMSKSDYKAYITECEEMGYTVEAESDGNAYDAYNESGYKLSLWYADYNEELHISLDAPKEMGTLKWTNSELVKLLPEPKSTVGKILRESSEGFYIYVGKTAIDDFNEYIDECSEAGFNKDYERGDKYYRGYDEAGNYVSLAYEGNSVMTVELTKAEEEIIANTTDTVVAEEENVVEVEETVIEDENKSELVDGMRPEFIEAMNEYEDFMNEYCDFMEKYAESNGTDIGLLTDYAKYVSKYADMVEAFAEWEGDDMNTEEAKYYLDVQTRINKRLLEVAE